MAVLLQWTGESRAPSTVDADVSSTDKTNGSLPTFDYDWTGGFASDPVYRIYQPNGSTSLAGAVTNGSYWYFTVTPDSGKEMDLTSLTMNAARGGASTPRGYGLYSSIDSYATVIQTADVDQQVTTWMAVSVDLSGAAYQNLSSSVTFRIYWYAPDSVSMFYDTVTLNGTVSASGTPPTVTTTSISSITSSSASSGGTVTAEGSSAVTDYGVCWNTTGTPTIADSHTHDKP